MLEAVWASGWESAGEIGVCLQEPKIIWDFRWKGATKFDDD
jgi:hypothetical protein